MTRADTILVGLLLLTACSGSTAFRVRAYAAPSDRSGGFVVVYHPWDVEAGGRAVGRGGFSVAQPFDDHDHVDVTCTNMPCELHGDSVMPKPPAGVDHVELVIAKRGYVRTKASVKLVVSRERTLLVMLEPEINP